MPSWPSILDLEISDWIGRLVCLGALAAGLAAAERKNMEIRLTSAAFTEGGMIPRQYTCDGKNVSPPLAWSGLPATAKTLVLISDDPDAPVGTWVHWVLFNLPASAKDLPEHVPPLKTLPNAAKQGTNDFGRIGYGGPCPPGGPHRYFFKLDALDTELKLEAGVTKAQVLKAMEGHVLAEGQLMGRYKR
jgi:Raf kinase inhibitor-like YbhB/YbcL family protein